jgi:hypothetical protein
VLRRKWLPRFTCFVPEIIFIITNILKNLALYNSILKEVAAIVSEAAETLPTSAQCEARRPEST